MPLLDQFRRPDRGKTHVSGEKRQKDTPENYTAENYWITTTSTGAAAVANNALPNHASEEDAA
jgi:hypothetical protein